MSGKSTRIGRMRFVVDITTDSEHRYIWSATLDKLLKEVAYQRVRYGTSDEIYDIYVTTEPEMQYLDPSKLYVFTNAYGNSKVATGRVLRNEQGEHTLKVRRAFEMPIEIQNDGFTMEDEEYFIYCAYLAMDHGKQVELTNLTKNRIDAIEFDEENMIYNYGLKWKNRVYDEVYLEDDLAEGIDSESISTSVGDII